MLQPEHGPLDRLDASAAIGRFEANFGHPAPQAGKLGLQRLDLATGILLLGRGEPGLEPAQILLQAHLALLQVLDRNGTAVVLFRPGNAFLPPLVSG